MSYSFGKLFEKVKEKTLYDMPKSVVKAIRYIKQEAPRDKLADIEGLLLTAIEQRREVLQRQNETSEIDAHIS